MRICGLAVVVCALALTVAACSSPLGREYEYAEEMYLGVDGSASIIVNGSVPAFVALRGLPLDPDPGARIDRQAVRDAFESVGCDVTSVGQPWRRHGRRFVQVRIETEDVRTLTGCGALAWSEYSLESTTGAGETLRYRQTVGAAAGGDPGAAEWTGQEIVGFKLHVPSRIDFHNVKRLEDGENGKPGRGNILAFEQRLSDRRRGVPLELDVVMGSQSILYRTLFLFVGSFAVAVTVLGTLIWLTVRRGRKQARRST